jgi:hypothetical protein
VGAWCAQQVGLADQRLAREGHLADRGHLCGLRASEDVVVGQPTDGRAADVVAGAVASHGGRFRGLLPARLTVST